jgi:hypothetical protein
MSLLESQQTEIEDLSQLLRLAEEENLKLKEELEEQQILNETLNEQNKRLIKQNAELESLKV